MTDFYLSYSPNDFFYESVGNIGVTSTNNFALNNNECDALLSQNWDNSCNVWFSDNSLNCIKLKLCKNKTNAEQLSELETTHASANGKTLDVTNDFQYTFLNTINLSIGILFVFFIIYKMQGITKQK